MNRQVEGRARVARVVHAAQVRRHARRSVDGERLAAAVEAHRGQEAGQSVEVIAVHVADEDGLDGAGTEGALEDLLLRSFAAVEEQRAAVHHHRGGGEVALARRRAGAGPEEDEADLIHNDDMLRKATTISLVLFSVAAGLFAAG